MNLREWQLQTHKAIRNGGLPGSLFENADATFPVYPEMFRLRVLGMFRDEFPLLHRLLGEKRFCEKASAFISSFQSYVVEISALAEPFAAFLESSGERATTVRAAKLDQLESRAARAAETEPGGKLFGLHPSASLFEMDGRRYVIWREERYVRRERLRAQDLKFLRCFERKAELAEMSARVERQGLSQNFVRDSAALWTKLGLLVSFKE